MENMKSTFLRLQLAVFLLMFISVLGCGEGDSGSTVTAISFEVYPWGDPTFHLDEIDHHFSSWGISEITSQDKDGNITPAVIGQYLDPWLKYPSGVSALAPWPGDWTYYGTAQAPITIRFDSPVQYFSVYAMDVGYNGLVVTAYDSHSSVLAKVLIDGEGRDHTGIPDGNGIDFIEISESGISKITFSQMHSPEIGLGPEGYLLDDMSFIIH